MPQWHALQMQTGLRAKLLHQLFSGQLLVSCHELGHAVANHNPGKERLQHLPRFLAYLVAAECTWIHRLVRKAALGTEGVFPEGVAVRG